MRDNTIDIAKGIAIILVVVGHCTLISGLPHRFIYSFHMPLFFIIGGSFYHEKAITVSLKSDFYRLIVPYIVFASIYILKFAITSLYNENYESILTVLLGAIYTNSGSDHTSYFLSNMPGIGTIWFLPALFVCRNLFNALYVHLSVKNFYPTIMLISLLCIILDVYVVNLPLGILTGSSAMIFYLFGYYSKENYIASGWKIVGVICWLIAIQYSHLYMGNCHYGMYPIDVAGACAGTCVILYTSKYIMQYTNYISTFLSWMGRLSLVVLCMHFIDILIDVNTRLDVKNWIVYIFLEFLIIVPLTYHDHAARCSHR